DRVRVLEQQVLDGFAHLHQRLDILAAHRPDNLGVGAHRRDGLLWRLVRRFKPYQEL
ncbi:hypothetical protein OC834_007991, partial [Tilletia horrida]